MLNTAFATCHGGSARVGQPPPPPPPRCYSTIIVGISRFFHHDMFQWCVCGAAPSYLSNIQGHDERSSSTYIPAWHWIHNSIQSGSVRDPVAIGTYLLVNSPMIYFIIFEFMSFCYWCHCNKSCKLWNLGIPEHWSQPITKLITQTEGFSRCFGGTTKSLKNHHTVRNHSIPWEIAPDH